MTTATTLPTPRNTCDWWISPIPKLDNHTCQCIRDRGHADKWHHCRCNAHFQGCGHPPTQTPRIFIGAP